MTKINSCYECKDRHPACHDHCKRYQEAKEEYLEKTRKIKHEKYKDALATSFTVESTAKTRGKKLRCI